MQQAPKAAAEYANAQAAELRKQGQEEEAQKWEEGGAYLPTFLATCNAINW